MAYAGSLKEAIIERTSEYSNVLEELAKKTLSEIKDYMVSSPDFIQTNGIYSFSITNIDLSGETSVQVEQAFSSEVFSSIDYIVNHAKKDIILTLDEYINKYEEAIEEHVVNYDNLRIYDSIMHHPSFWKHYVNMLIQVGFEVRIVNYNIRFSQGLRFGEIPKEGFLVIFKLDQE